MRAFVAAALLAAIPAAAQAGCFDGFGCTDQTTFDRSALSRLSCQDLWYVRNSIYDDRGYCFKTQQAMSVFDNTGCFINDTANVPLNQHERNNIARIVQIEKQRGC